MAAFDALLSKTISSVINGMSQQPAAIRLKSQCEEQVNCLSDVVSGVSRRPPTQNQMSPNWTGSGWPSSNPAGGVYVFPINRGSAEQFIGILTDKDINVYNLAGTEMTVTDNGAAGVPTNYTYLDFDTATYTAAEAFATAFATVTVADYTFIVNKTKTVAMSGNSGASSTVTRTQDHEFLMWMGAVPDDTTVNLTIGGTATSAATGATLRHRRDRHARRLHQLEVHPPRQRQLALRLPVPERAGVRGRRGRLREHRRQVRRDQHGRRRGVDPEVHRPARRRLRRIHRQGRRLRWERGRQLLRRLQRCREDLERNTTMPRRSGKKQRQAASTISSTPTPCPTPSSTRAAQRSTSSRPAGPTARRATP
jgi:hypothetical protein